MVAEAWDAYADLLGGADEKGPLLDLDGQPVNGHVDHLGGRRRRGCGALGGRFLCTVNVPNFSSIS